MNRSIVIMRYATALVKYTREAGQGEQVCAEAQALGRALRELPDLRRMVTAASDVVSGAQKTELLQKVLGQLTGGQEPDAGAHRLGPGLEDMVFCPQSFRQQRGPLFGQWRARKRGDQRPVSCREKIVPYLLF